MDFIDAIYTVKHNPFKYSEYFYSFYNELENVENNLLLTKLLLPFCNHPELSSYLNYVNKNSTLVTKFNKPQQFFDINEHIKHFEQLTYKSLNCARANDLLIIDTENLSITTSNKTAEIKTAKNLGKLFNHYKVEDIYNHFRIENHEISYL